MRLTLGVAVAALVLGAAGLAGALAQHGQVSRLQSQVAAERAMITRAGKLIAAQQARLAGATRFAITCGDLRHLRVAGLDANGIRVITGYRAGRGPGAVTLPAHCVR